MTSGRAWLAIFAFVLGWDCWACRCGHETLSCGFTRALASPRSRGPVLVLTGYLVAHLCGSLLPERFSRIDLLAAVARYMRPAPAPLPEGART